MNTTRRTFIKTTAAAALGFPAILRAANPNSNLQIAAVGCSGKGLSDILEVGSHARVKYVGFCDADTSRFGKADEKFPGVPHFQDFREMFAKLGNTFDAAIVSTPDHMHAFIGLEAMRRGKHVYCQKPLTHTLWEARQMRLQAAKSKVATQMGNQIHSASEYRTATKLIHDGVIGKIREVHSWQDKKGNFYTGLTGALPPSGPVPAALNWDWWIGVAPMRDYSPDAYHPAKWRDWQDFGGGVMGDFGCHIMDPVFTSLGLTAPISVRGENDGINPQTWPASETIHYVFPGTRYTAGQTLPLTWYDGGRRPDAALLPAFPEGKKAPGSGSLFIGEGGSMILPHVGMPQLFPSDKFATPYTPVEKGNHYHSWVDAALGGPKTTAGFDYAGPLTEAVHLGNIATRIPNETLKWDAAAMKITGKSDANRLLTKTYRDGWKIEAVA